MERAQPKVSVVTPLYNSAGFVRATLDSLLAQTYANWEAILVDDGSTDDTAEVVRPYLADPRFHLIRQENRGIAGARNTAIQRATGEWVCLLDHDDRWLPHKLERQVDFALAHGCDIVCTDAFVLAGADRWLYSRGYPEATERLRLCADDPGCDVFGLLIAADFLCASTVMLRRSLFEERGLLDPEAAPADDYDMWLRCMPEAKIGFVDEPLVEYVVHAGNYSQNLPRMYEQAIRVLRTHRKRFASDPARVAQFDEALVRQHRLLFERLLADGGYGPPLRHALALLKEGRAAGPLLRTFLAPLGERLKNSARHRLRLLRPRGKG